MDISKTIPSPYKVTKFSIHFTDVNGNNFQHVINYDSKALRLFKQVAGSNQWTEVESGALKEKGPALVDDPSQQFKKSEAQKMIGLLMALVGFEKIQDLLPGDDGDGN